MIETQKGLFAYLKTTFSSSLEKLKHQSLRNEAYNNGCISKIYILCEAIYKYTNSISDYQIPTTM